MGQRAAQQIQYRPDVVDGCLADVGLSFLAVPPARLLWPRVGRVSPWLVATFAAGKSRLVDEKAAQSAVTEVLDGHSTPSEFDVGGAGYLAPDDAHHWRGHAVSKNSSRGTHGGNAST